jgi:hypothetical protein
MDIEICTVILKVEVICGVDIAMALYMLQLELSVYMSH